VSLFGSLVFLPPIRVRTFAMAWPSGASLIGGWLFPHSIDLDSISIIRLASSLFYPIPILAWSRTLSDAPIFLTSTTNPMDHRSNTAVSLTPRANVGSPTRTSQAGTPRPPLRTHSRELRILSEQPLARIEQALIRPLTRRRGLDSDTGRLRCHSLPSRSPRSLAGARVLLTNPSGPWTSRLVAGDGVEETQIKDGERVKPLAPAMGGERVKPLTPAIDGEVEGAGARLEKTPVRVAGGVPLLRKTKPPIKSSRPRKRRPPIPTLRLRPHQKTPGVRRVLPGDQLPIPRIRPPIPGVHQVPHGAHRRTPGIYRVTLGVRLAGALQTAPGVPRMKPRRVSPSLMQVLGKGRKGRGRIAREAMVGRVGVKGRTPRPPPLCHRLEEAGGNLLRLSLRLPVSPKVTTSNLIPFPPVLLSPERSTHVTWFSDLFLFRSHPRHPSP
jgi:hypothetical protein